MRRGVQKWRRLEVNRHLSSDFEPNRIPIKTFEYYRNESIGNVGMIQHFAGNSRRFTPREAIWLTRILDDQVDMQPVSFRCSEKWLLVCSEIMRNVGIGPFSTIDLHYFHDTHQSPLTLLGFSEITSTLLASGTIQYSLLIKFWCIL